MAGLIFRLYVKLFLPSTFNSLHFWSSMSCIVLDIELAEKNVMKDLGVFIDGKVQGHSFGPSEKYKPTKRAFWWAGNLKRSVWNSGGLSYSDVPNFLLEM